MISQAEFTLVWTSEVIPVNDVPMLVIFMREETREPWENLMSGRNQFKLSPQKVNVEVGGKIDNYTSCKADQNWSIFI